MSQGYDRQYPVGLTPQVDAPAVNTAAVVTIAAPGVGYRTLIKQLLWSYSAAPTGGRLTITDAGVTVLDIDIIAGGPGPLMADYTGGDNAVLVVTLAAATITGKLTVWSHKTSTIPGVARS